MSIITITSEWNNWDYYLASLKAKLTAICEDVKIVDIMHSIKPFDIMGTAFIIKSCFHHFPTNTIHIICVDSDPVKYPVLAIKYQDHFFIGSDNGVFSLLFLDEILEIQEIPVPNTSTSFIELDVFIDIAVKLYKKQPFGNIGRPILNIPE